jgi:hypothetical protein
METSKEVQTKTEPQSSPPERGRAWRIVAVVLTLHAALLGSVVLIQGCSKNDTTSLADQEKASKSGTDSQIASKENSSDPKNLTERLPSNDGLLPEENLGNAETGSSASGTSDLMTKTEEPKVDTSIVSSAPKPAPLVSTPDKESAIKQTPPAPVVAATKPAPVSLATYTVKKAIRFRRSRRARTYRLKI